MKICKSCFIRKGRSCLKPDICEAALKLLTVQSCEAKKYHYDNIVHYCVHIACDLYCELQKMNIISKIMKLEDHNTRKNFLYYPIKDKGCFKKN